MPICDRTIINETKWYKATDDMVTNETQIGLSCGTTYALWMQGTIPTEKDSIGVEEDRTVCVPGVMSTCEDSFLIKIMNCGSYRLYKLKKPSSCPQAYCFGYGVKDTPPTQKVLKPKVEHTFTRENGKNIQYQFSNFKCVFTFLNSPDPTKPYLYQIYWYINGENKYVTEPLRKEEFEQSYLNERNGLDKMGVKISCSVKLKYNRRGIPGPMSDKSQEIFVGIQLSSESLHITRGGSGQVDLTFTVPFPCGYYSNAVHINKINKDTCPLHIELAVPLKPK
uniref:Uncharacterized protein LOC111124130 n=1 Tax=Crassostrea virginica TaxID=6565 RepID=A0A8B8D3J2_CRAVI|nr:uncharacterized protein LOC111124130 [Crassostrea virginica]